MPDTPDILARILARMSRGCYEENWSRGIPVLRLYDPLVSKWVISDTLFSASLSANWYCSNYRVGQT